MRTLLFKTLAQKAAASNFYFSKEVKLILIIFFMANVSLAQIKTSKITGGRWSDASTWVEGSIPGPGDAVTIVAGSSVVIRTSTDGLILNGISDPATCTSLTVNGVLTLGSGGGSGSKYLNVSDFVTISNGGVLTNDAVELHRLNVGGNFTNNGTFNPIIGSGLIQTTFNGAGAQVIDGLSSTQTFYSFIVQKSGGALTTSSNVTNLTVSFFTLTSGDFVAPSSLTSSGTMTLTAGTYTAGANTFLGGNFTNNGASFVPGTGTVTFNGSGTQTIGGSTTNPQFYNITTSGSNTLISGSVSGVVTLIDGNLLVGDGTTFQVARPLTVKGTTTIGNGTSGKLLISSLDGAKTFEGRVSISSGGTWDNDDVNENARFYNGITNNGTFIAGSGLYNFEVNSQSIEGVISIPLVDVATGVTLTNNGTFTVATDLAGQGSLAQGNNAELNVGGTFGISSLSTAGTNNTVNYTGGAQTVKGVPYVNLGLSGSGVKTLTALTVTISGNLTLSETASATTVNNLTIGGNLSIGTSSSLTNGVSRTLTVGNSLSGDGTLAQSSNSILNINGGSTLTSLNASATGNTVNYNAASPLIIPGSYHNLFLNQSSGNALLNGNTSVAGALTLNTGNLVLGVNNLTLGTSAALSIASPSASRMIIASGAGELRRTFSSTGSFVFPIGDNTATLEYSPVTVNITSAAGFSSAYVGVSVIDAKHPSNASTTHFLSRYWNITQSGITTCVATISGTYPAADINGTESSIKAAQLNGNFIQTSNSWIKYASLTSSPMVVTGATLTGLTSAFTGITGADPIVTIGGDVAICAGSSFPLASSVTADPTILYSWSPATGLSAANVANPTASPTNTTDYTLTITDGNGQSSVSAPKKVTVNTLPLAPAVTTPVSYCLNATATALTATGTNLLWYTTATGGTGSATAPTPVTSAAVNTSYWVSQTNANNCEGPRSEIVVTVNSLPLTPTASATAQPTCSVATGTITVNSSLIGLSFSIDGTDFTNTTGVFTSLAAGNYTVKAKNASGCISPASSTITINAQPATPVAPTASATAQPTCSVATGTITVSSALTGLSFSIDGSDYTNTSGVFTGLVADNYTVTSKNGAGCVSVASSIITINAQPATPAAPTASATAQPTCSVATGTITVSSALTGLSFSIDGSDYTNTTGVFTGLVAGNYTVSSKNGAGCVSVASSIITINAQPTTPTAPTASATSQPTCSVATGTITVSSSLTGLSFSINGTDFTNTTGVFAGLSSGDYTVTAKNVAGCISTPSSTITINVAIGAPAPPTASATAQPTCSVATGTITVSSALTGLSFSIDGSDYTNTTGVFTGLTAGNYIVRAKNVAECISASSTITINAQPATPTAPTVIAVQPTCSVATGEITVSSSIAGLSFSIDGSDYTNTTGVFTGLAPNNYTITAKNGAGCISSTSSTITINAQPATPVVPTVSATAQPTCSVATGTITVSSDLTGLSFSIDGSDYTNTTGVFTGLTPNDYTVTAKNGAGCISSASSTITINAQPLTPAVPTASATVQPTCTVPTGEITVSSSLTGLSFSIDGSDYTNTTGVFTGLTPGDYTVTAKNVSGCVTAASSTITINVAIGAPAAPIASATAQPTCTVATGEITVSSDPTGLSFSIDGSDFTNTTGVFTALVPGNYTITAKNVAECISTTSTITINPQPATPAAPTASATTQPTCIVTTGVITVSSDLTGLSFSIDGSDFTNTTGVFTGLAPGDYTVIGKNVAGCISSASSTITINGQPAPPSVSTPSAALCVGATMTLSPGTGGTWVSSTPGVATINSTTGLVTGVSAGTVTFTFTSTATGCSSTTSSVTVSPLPGKPVITTSNLLTETPTLTSSNDTGNQWFKDNVAITGATGKTLTVSANGSYTVQVTTNGCASAFSDAVAIVITGIEQRIISNRSAIYPNPAKEVIQIDWSDFASESGIEVKIYDQVGRLIITKVMASSDNSLDVRSLEQGSYVFLARQNGTLLIQRFIKN